MHEWLRSACERLAASVGDEPSGYDLGDEDVATLLELARVAAHESGERTNAPLAAYLVGLAHGRHGDRRLGELVDGVIRAPE
jgi:hypothetical protein